MAACDASSPQPLITSTEDNVSFRINGQKEVFTITREQLYSKGDNFLVGIERSGTPQSKDEEGCIVLKNVDGRGISPDLLKHIFDWLCDKLEERNLTNEIISQTRELARYYTMDDLVKRLDPVKVSYHRVACAMHLKTAGSKRWQKYEFSPIPHSKRTPTTLYNPVGIRILSSLRVSIVGVQVGSLKPVLNSTNDSLQLIIVRERQVIASAIFARTRYDTVASFDEPIPICQQDYVFIRSTHQESNRAMAITTVETSCVTRGFESGSDALLEFDFVETDKNLSKVKHLKEGTFTFTMYTHNSKA